MNGPHGHHAWVFTPAWARAALTHRVFTGLSRQHLGELIVELADPRTAAHEGALQQRRGHPRRRAPGAGPPPPVGLRRSGAGHPGRLALPTATSGLGGAVRRGPRHRHPRGRRGPAAAGRARLRPPPSPTVRAAPCGRGRCGQVGCTTRVRSPPRASRELLRSYPTVMARVDTGYRGLAKTFPDRVCAPPPKPAKDAAAEEIAADKQAPTRQSSRRICVEHASPSTSSGTLHRTPRGLRPNASGHRRPGLRPSRPPPSGPPDRARRTHPNLNRAPSR
jgi:hypothetical protein